MKLKLRREFVPNPDRLQVLSSGGGTQSNCIIVLIAMGCIPKPDLIVMSDTEREASNVFDYQRNYIAPICEAMGVEYMIIKKSDWTKNDITTYTDDDSVLPPFFTTMSGYREDGKAEGKMPGFCSSKWKLEPITRYLNDRYGKRELDKKGVDFWIGMSFDEAKRVKYPTGKWQKRYPLFESQIIRSQAIQIVKDFGLPEPPRSSCWMCPNRTDEEWEWMKNNVPGDFEQAVNFEKELQKDFDWMWLHREAKKLNEVIFMTGKPKQVDIFDQFCDTGMCFV